MEEKRYVPYIVWEGEKARDERRHRRDFIIKLVLIILLFLSNAIWLYAWMQYDYVGETETITVDGGERGMASYIGRDGDISYGEDCSTQDLPEAD